MIYITDTYLTLKELNMCLLYNPSVIMQSQLWNQKQNHCVQIRFEFIAFYNTIGFLSVSVMQAGV